MNRHTIDGVFTIVLFAIFALLALLVTASGASAYRRTAEEMEQRFNRQTCVDYITARVRGNNENGSVSVEKLGDVEALVLSKDTEIGVYLSRIYYYDGKIMELMSRNDMSFNPESGSVICEAQGLSFSDNGNMITITLTDTSGKPVEVSVSRL